MPSKLPARRPSHAVVVAYLSLFVALGGSSYAAVKITGKNVKDNSLTGRDIKNLGSADVKNRSLLARDFKAGQLPAGARGTNGVQGAKGEPGPRGATGTVDTSNFYSKSASDARFLGITGTAADSDQLGGLEPTDFLRATTSATGITEGNGPITILTIEGAGELLATCGNPEQATVSWRNTSGANQVLTVDDGGTNPAFFDPLGDLSIGGEVTGAVQGADHVVYMVRSPGTTWIDVFTTTYATGCFYFTRVYGP